MWYLYTCVEMYFILANGWTREYFFLSAIRSPFRTGPQGASRLAKAGFLHRFRELVNLSRRRDLEAFPTYHAVKQAAREYQQNKEAFINHLQDGGFGHWFRKPREQEFFEK